MIVSFRHKGLADFYHSGSTRGINPAHSVKLSSILAALDAAICPDDLALPSYRLHPLKGNLKGYWSITVNANWRVIFKFCGQDVELVDYVDYHLGQYMIHTHPHPGTILRSEVIDALGITVSDAAERLAMSRVALSRVLNGKASISSSLAVRLERAGVSTARFWLALQTNYDLWLAQQSDYPEIKALQPLAA